MNLLSGVDFTRYVFICGAQKAGTTSLASWLIENDLVAATVINGRPVKEPNTYLHTVGSYFLERPRCGKPILDASVTYFDHEHVVSRFPEHYTKILICLRNQFDRAWSSFRMSKVIALQDVFGDYSSDSKMQLSAAEMRALHYEMYPRASHLKVSEYLSDEFLRLSKSSFRERVEYELSFLSVYKRYPFMSILCYSFYSNLVKVYAKKYMADDITFLSVKLLENPAVRTEFVSRVFGEKKLLNSISKKFSMEDYDIGEEKPDFYSSEWDFLRDKFWFDYNLLRKNLCNYKVSESFIDYQDLNKYF